MNPEVKKMWVEALRSGKYNQTTDALQRDGGFCCLGVLCDLHSKETGTQWEDNRFYDGKDKNPSLAVMDWAGLDDDCGGNVTIEENDLALTEHNDQGRTFAEIANAIEEQL